MGKKVANLVAFLGVVSVVLLIVGACLPMHKTVMVLVVAPVGTIATGLTHTRFVGIEKSFRDNVKRQAGAEYNKGFWDSAQEWQDLETVRSHACTPALQTLFGGLCQAYETAYGMGIAVIIILSLNIACQIGGCYLLHDYVTRKANPKYREMSASMILMSSAVLLFIMIIYGAVALTHLNSMTSGGILPGVKPIQTSKGSGFSKGYVVMICGCIVQLIQGMLLLAYTQNEYGEDMYFENKEAREAGLEMTGMNRGMANGAGMGMVGGMGGGMGMQGGGVVMMQQPTPMMQPAGMVMMQQQPAGVIQMGGPVPAPGTPAW
eukprot:CAMPEP_0206461214 /NCGR_PEP_ID=MMETSP0324_2-20121206/25221_1 /ASSEMBLY_ACC=CAM_ASM_000836 /TAXON_ID=2866 /ORGANISM="Crypthecodinium cohnii, Strain Seligo" /LENGTH=318 /DNA_ID=CAMNT_0053933079 /DNA_START=111 /DNA_END=1067 /DNA_ORIENTATION=+